MKLKNLHIRAFCALLLAALLWSTPQAGAQSLEELLKKDKPAQSAEPPPVPAKEEAPVVVPPPEQKEYLPHYLAEMHGFYEYCEKDTYLNTNYDCGCMAEKYVDKRIELGDDATSDQIISAINKECLHEGKAGMQIQGEDGELVNLTDEQIQEMQDVYDNCAENYYKSKSYDCECLAASYMTKKLEKGGTVGRATIMLELEGTCLNVEDMAGLTYQQCMERPPTTLAISRKSPEEFCECMANVFAEMYGGGEGSMTPKMGASMKSYAQSKCL